MEKLVNVRKEFLRIRKIARHPRVSTIHTFEKFPDLYINPSTSPLRVCGRTTLEEESSNISEISPLLLSKKVSYRYCHVRAFVFWFPKHREISVNGCDPMPSRTPLPFLHEICKAKTGNEHSPPSIIVIKHVLHILHFVARARAINAN